MISRFFHQTAKIQRSTLTNDKGFMVKTWANIATVQGVLDNLSGRESWVSEKVSSSSSHVFYCKPIDMSIEAFHRLFSNVPFSNGQTIEEFSTKDRLFLDGLYYNIRYIRNPMSYNRHIEIACELMDSENV
jgi:head-tail adaptor